MVCSYVWETAVQVLQLPIAYSIRYLLSPLQKKMSRRFVISARVGEDILDFSDKLIALATLDALLLDYVCDGFAHGDHVD